MLFHRPPRIDVSGPWRSTPTTASKPGLPLPICWTPTSPDRNGHLTLNRTSTPCGSAVRALFLRGMTPRLRSADVLIQNQAGASLISDIALRRRRSPACDCWPVKASSIMEVTFILIVAGHDDE